MVKKIIKEEVDNVKSYSKYINNIYNKQSEYPVNKQLDSFASENGYDTDLSVVDKALKMYKNDTEENTFGEQYYTKKAIENMINYIVKNG